MQTQEIPRGQWANFFDSFSQQHEGWIATLEILSTQLGAHHEADELSFEGISMSLENGGSKEAIVISLAKSRVDHVSHMIEHPRRVWLQQTEEGANASLEIEGEDDARTLLRFRSPIRPEFVDGIV